LRSNFWLTVHVLIITLSYAAFALAMGIGNWTLLKFITKPQDPSIRTLVQMIYRTMQIGVLLLTAGTILGGVWADYSWGRFWGWDPKEVWALIALLFYLVIVHGKYAGWLRDFGVASGAVLAFQGVLTAWYGVNFVMGVGLHSYGFGTGGIGYVLSFTFIEIAIVILAWTRYRSHRGLHSPHNMATQ
ncbi:MAG: cytochrome c biogenesis protein CcsA, partial [Deltaproteobacteria bacterium]|nr:cytochrome c biogenesis protein CcsA [Deltaproteobacteria bacterium]